MNPDVRTLARREAVNDPIIQLDKKVQQPLACGVVRSGALDELDTNKLTRSMDFANRS